MPDRGTLLSTSERAWLDRLILPLPRGATILDLGCGGGEPIDRYLIDHGFHIVGIDNGATAIELARTRFPRERWLLGDMRTVALDETFAGIVAWSSLESLPSGAQDMMAERIMAWLKPGGRLLLSGNGDVLAHGAALTRRGMAQMAHVDSDPSCGGMNISLMRKP
jgi:2-polyprenyl-3-methyl-5-hydroxy-6-metoxy-1,4-benzoquinol methylase